MLFCHVGGVISRDTSAKSVAEPREKAKVALLAYEGISPFHLAGPLLVFGGNSLDEPVTELSICTVAGIPIHTTVGLHISSPYGLEEMERADVIIVPGWMSANTPVDDTLRDALLRAQERGAQIIGLCLGVFALARTGMLDGRRATTHWMRSRSFAESFPRVQLEPDILYTRDGNIWTSAGGAAAIDVCSLVLREVCGPAAAAGVARRIVSAPYRGGNQHQLIARPLLFSSSDSRLRAAIEWLGSNLHEDHSVGALAARANMSPRTFSRRFKQMYGTTLLRWLLNEQLQCACSLLETTNLTIDGIAATAGFNSTAALRRHFGRAFHCSPNEYRRDHHQGLPPSLEDAA